MVGQVEYLICHMDLVQLPFFLEPSMLYIAWHIIRTPYLKYLRNGWVNQCMLVKIYSSETQG